MTTSPRKFVSKIVGVHYEGKHENCHTITYYECETLPKLDKKITLIVGIQKIEKWLEITLFLTR